MYLYSASDNKKIIEGAKKGFYIFSIWIRINEEDYYSQRLNNTYKI